MATYTIDFWLQNEAGVLTDADSDVLLSNAAATAGVWNTATPATIIVADGTAMTQAVGDTGHYTYTFTYGVAEAANTILYGTNYSYSVEYAFGGFDFRVNDTFDSDVSSTAEPTTTPVYADLVLAITDAFPDETTAARQARIIKDAFTMLLYPPQVLVEGRPVAGYRWSFLSPSYTLTLADGTENYNMEASFGGARGTEWAIDSTTHYPPVVVTTPAQIELLRRGSPADGYPTHLAFRPKSFAAATGQRWEAMVFPAPDAAYSVKGAVLVNHDAITSGQYIPGGPIVAAAAKACCKAAAELLNSGGAEGHYYGLAQKAIGDAIAHDLETRPRNLGYAADYSDAWRVYDPRGTGVKTYNDVDITI